MRFNGKETVDYIKPVKTLQKELLHNYEKYGITDYRILDDTCNDTEKKLDAMLEVVKELPFQPKFWAYIRLDLMTKHPHTLTKMYDIGIRGMFFGIETLHLPSGRLIGKGFKTEKLIEMAQHVRERYGNEIHTTGSFIVGLPGESVESVLNTQERVYSGELPLHDAQFWPLTFDNKKYFYWQSDLSINFEKFGYTQTEDSPSEERIGWKNDKMDWRQAHDIVAKWSARWLEKKQENMLPVWFNNENLGSASEIVKDYKQRVCEYLNISFN